MSHRCDLSTIIWIDELAKFYAPDELWAQIEMTLRLSENPQIAWL